MLETPGDFNQRASGLVPLGGEAPPSQRDKPVGSLRKSRYPADNLSGYRYHTGASLSPLRPDEVCPVLFRDLGPVALARFLRGQLRRLAGPQSPIIYMRTEEYVEPYTDHEQIGRIILLRPLLLQPWHSGVPAIYVAKANQSFEAAAIGFVPGEVPLTEAAQLAREVTDVRQLREVLGGRAHDEAAAETLNRLDQLAGELASTEEKAAPLRQALQSAERPERERARAEMARVGLTESDLCTAWHHLPRQRRGEIGEALRRVMIGP